MKKFFAWLKSLFVGSDSKSRPQTSLSPIERSSALQHHKASQATRNAPKPSHTVAPPARMTSPYRYHNGGWYDNQGVSIDYSQWLLLGILSNHGHEVAVDRNGCAVTDAYGNPIYMDERGKAYDGHGNAVSVDGDAYHPENAPINNSPEHQVISAPPIDSAFQAGIIGDQLPQPPSTSLDPTPIPASAYIDPLPQPVEPSYSAPEPSYSSSYDSGGGGYDSGGCDSGGGDGGGGGD